MTDCELLELAAKAAGVPIDLAFGLGNWVGPVSGNRFFSKWNPLTDDGDALRLAVKLSIDVYFGEDDGPATYAGWYGSEANTQRQRYAVERHNADPYAATRRAIVRAAAEIGKGMQ